MYKNQDIGKIKKIIQSVFSLLLIMAFTTAYLYPTLTASAKAPGQGATAPDFGSIDAFVQSELQAIHMPGAALGIVHGDQVVHLKTFGVADPSGRVVSTDTPFILGSVSKSFTALAVMQLVEAGKINLDAPIQHYLPMFRVANPRVSAEITVRQLLNHTSGLPGQAGFLAIRSSDESDAALEQHILDLSSVQLDRPIGSKYEYSNANYDILGLLVQVVSAQPFETYIQEHIFTPLDMRESYTSRDRAALNGLAQGYQHLFGLPVVRDWPYPRGMVPSGFLISSVNDMTHFMIAQLNGGRYADHVVISPQGIAAMQTGTAQIAAGASYGMGWTDATIQGVRLVAHDGDTYNYHASIYLIPESKWGVVLLMNGSNALDFTRMSLIAQSAAGMLIGAKVSPISPQNQILLMNELYRNSFVFAILMGIVAVWSWRRLRRWQVHPETRPTNGVVRIAWLVLPLLFFLWEAWLFLFSLPQVMGGWPLNILFYFRPDLTGLAVLMGVFSVAWGVFYEVQALRILSMGPGFFDNRRIVTSA